ncbi:hypothetical protein ACFL0Z_01320, partial [Patescibacteria group bacterium]
PELVLHLQKIADKEGVRVSQEALELIAQQSDGCARDAISLFTQLVAYARGNIDQTLVKEVLGVTDQVAVSNFVAVIITGDKAAGIEQLRQLVEGGYDLEQFTKNLVEYFRKILLVNAGADVDDVILADLSSEQLNTLQEQAKNLPLGQTVPLIKIFLDAQKELGRSIYPQLPLELALIEYLSAESALEPIKKIDQKSPAVTVPPVPKRVSVPKVDQPVQPVSEIVKAGEEKTSEAIPEKTSLGNIEGKWPQVIEEIAPVNNSLAAFLRMCVLKKMEGEYLTLAFKFRFHKEQIAEHKYRRLVEDVMKKVYQEKILLKCVVDDKLIEKKEEKSVAPDIANVQDAPEDVAEMAKNVFGGKLI